MKNALKLLAAVVVASVVFTGCNCFGKMAKRQNEVTISCTPDVLALNNGKVSADITVKFPAEYYNKKAVLKVTPVIVFAGGEVEGATKYFQGTAIHDNYTVVDSNMGGSFTQHVEFPYDARMQQSELQLRVEVKCPSGKCKTFTLVDANTGLLPTKAQAATLAAGGAEAEALKRAFGLTIAKGVNTLQSDLDYAAVMSQTANNYKNVTTVVTKADIMYAINSSRVTSKAANSDELKAFKENVVETQGNDRATQKLYVNGYASPDGPEKFNDKLSSARSESGKKAAEKLLKGTGMDLDAASYGEGLRTRNKLQRNRALPSVYVFGQAGKDNARLSRVVFRRDCGLVRNGCRRRSDRRQDNQGDLDGKPESNGILGDAILQLCGGCITAAFAR